MIKVRKASQITIPSSSARASPRSRIATGTDYTVFGYKGKQVRDNLHSEDLVSAFDAFFRALPVKICSAKL